MSDGAKAKIFIVEDQVPILKLLVRALGEFPDLELLGTAADGEEGAAGIVQARPDVAIVDLELPGCDGIEVTRRVKRAAPQIEVLILTTFDDERKVYEAIQAGAAGYLVKRVGPEKVRAAVFEVLDGGVVIEAGIARRFWNYFDSVRAQKVATPNPWGLSPLELEVLQFVTKGLSNAEVGRVLSIERRTVRTHLGHIYRKMGVNSHVEAVVAALKAGVVDL